MSEETPQMKRRTWSVQRFKEEWLQDPELKDWLQRDSGDVYRSYCVYCKATLTNANKSMLLNHKKTRKHNKSFSKSKGKFTSKGTSETTVDSSNGTTVESNVETTVESSIETTIESDSGTVSEGMEIAKAEVFIAGYFAEHNVPLANIDHLLDVCKRAFPDSSIAKNMTFDKTKLSYTIQDGIAYHEKQELDEICRNQKFSIIMDGGSDASVTQVLAIVIRYFDSTKIDVVDVLFDTFVVEDGTAEDLFNAVKSLFEDRNIPLTNIIGFATDNNSTISGMNSGFQELLKSVVPSVFILGCVCHSFTLCSSHATSVLPPYLEILLKNLMSYFSLNTKSQNNFRTIQDVLQTSRQKIPKLAQTRLFSKENVITPILNQYNALTLYFQSESEIDEFDEANQIYRILNNCGTKHMLCFLQYVLGKVNILNMEFQSEHFRLHKLHSIISAEYKNILSFFIREECLKKNKLSQLDPSNGAYHKELDDIFLGGRTTALLEQEPLHYDDRLRFKSDCLNFLVEISLQIKKLFPFDEDNYLAKLKMLDPKVARNPKMLTTISSMATHFKSLISDEKLNDLDDEWRNYRMAKTRKYENQKIPEYWYKLRDITDDLYQPKFQLLSDFMTNLCILPHSSACVERIFSQINSIKTKNFNYFNADKIRSKVLARQCVTKYATCATWKPKEGLIHDLQDGSAYRRHTERLKEAGNSAEMTAVGENLNQDLEPPSHLTPVLPQVTWRIMPSATKLDLDTRAEEESTTQEDTTSDTTNVQTEELDIRWPEF